MSTTQTGSRVLLTEVSQICELLDIPFSAEQLAVIGAPLEPSVVIAGAGTGKTTAMAARVVWLVASGQLRADQVLGLTFTRKATAELSERIDGALRRAGILEPGDAPATVTTYDGFAASLVDEYGAWTGVEPGARLITRARCHQLALDVLAGLEAAPRMAGRLTPVSIAGAMISLSDQMAAHLVDVDQVRDADQAWLQQLDRAPTARGGRTYADVSHAIETVTEREELLGLVGRYQQLKADRGLVEYSDRMAQAVELARGARQVGRDLRSRFKVVLLDEYQDTSSAQAQLLMDLFTGPDPDTGMGHPVTAVGDPLQAIYGWRGAAASNILSFARQFPVPLGGGGSRPASQFTLLTNRRSGTRILDCANDLSADLRRSAAVAGRVGALRAPQGTREGRALCHGQLSWSAECAWVADTLVESRARGVIEAWSQAAVLVRRNSDVTDLYAALVGRQIPALVSNLSGLLQVPEVALVVAHLKLLADRRDNQAWTTLLSGPRLGLGPADLAAVGSRARELAGARARQDGLAGRGGLEERPQPYLADAVTDPGELSQTPRLGPALARLAGECRALAAHAVDGPDDLVLRIQQVSGLTDELAAAEPARRHSGQAHLDSLWSEVHAAMRDDPDLTLAGLISWLDAEQEFGDGLARSAPRNQDAVVISTVHGAKGLEWPMVILPDMDAGVFPSTLAPDNHVTRASVLPSSIRGDAGSVAQPGSGSREDLARYKEDLAVEARGAEDRLGYVALTRARDQLVLGWHRWRPPAVRPRLASDYALAVAARMSQWGLEVCEPPEAEETPDQVAALTGIPWPQPADPDHAERVRELAERIKRGPQPPAASHDGAIRLPDDPAEAALVAGWRRDAELLMAASDSDHRQDSGVVLPIGLTTSQLVALHADRSEFLDSLRRPMPRRVLPGADIGTRFHEWVARYLQPEDQQYLVPVDEDGEPLDAAAGGRLDPDLEGLRAAFLRSRWARATAIAVEEPFALTVAGRVIRGRLDAVVEDPDDPGRQVVVDWKTSAPHTADPLQLSVYRLAWAGATGVDPDRVSAVFHHVGANQTIAAQPLMSLAELAGVLELRE